MANGLVAWNRIDRDALRQVGERVPEPEVALILDRLATNPGLHGAGLPDLLLFPPVGAGAPRYELVEVKGPGDRLQANQERWLAFFREHGIPARVVHVERAAR